MAILNRLKRETNKVRALNNQGIESINRQKRELEEEKKEREIVDARLEAINIDLDILYNKRISGNGA